MPFNYDKKVTSEFKPRPITEVARKLGISAKFLKSVSPYITKVLAEELLAKLPKRDRGKLVVVTSITPTPLGEGKTVNTIGLSMALSRLGKKAVACLREPSLGPVFGMKGGATGGGHSQVFPADELNLHVTGDFDAVATAQNLAAAAIDNSFFWGNKLGLNKERIAWKRAIDMNDRVLRNVTVGGGGKLHGISRKSGFDITAASECMSILSLSLSLKDLRTRLGRIVVGFTDKWKPVTAEELKVAGAMAVVLKNALNPNLVQTLEHTPCFVHTGTFANVSHGSSSVIADLIALKLADFVVVESGFGADLGAEKFFDIKCRQAERKPDAAVINCSVRALKLHSNDFPMKGLKLPSELAKENLSAVDRGCSNLEKQVENIRTFGLPVVVCINRFEEDTKKEIDVVIRRAEAIGVEGIAVSEAYKLGSAGAADLAKAVMKAAKTKPKFHYLYPEDMNLRGKIERIAKSMYGATDVKYSDTAAHDVSVLEKAGLDRMPVCVAKTHLSLSNNPKKKGRPRGFSLVVEKVEASRGAGYCLVKCEDINTMPGLPEKARFAEMDVDVKTGSVKGLF